MDLKSIFIPRGSGARLAPALLWLLACGAPEPQAGQDRPIDPPGEQESQAVDEPPIDPPGEEESQTVDEPSIRPPGEEEPWTVSQLLEAPDSLVGKTLRVRGSCSGWDGPALGSSPLTRSDWQLQEGELAIWVSGPLPQGCDPVQPPPPETTFEITAVLAVDTVSLLAEPEPAVRRFLLSRSGG
jgi:hypothetical protein